MDGTGQVQQATAVNRPTVCVEEMHTPAVAGDAALQSSAVEAVAYSTYTTGHGEVRQIFRCNVCGQPFSETAGTPFYGLKTPIQTACVALQELAEGLGIRAVARIHGVEPDTVLEWLKKAGQHCEVLSTYMLQELHVTQVQLDELWTFVCKKERVLKGWEKVHSKWGDTWIWTAFDPVHKLAIAVLGDERTEAETVGFLARLRERLTAACQPLLTSDSLPHYAGAIPSPRCCARWPSSAVSKVTGPRLAAPISAR